MDNMAIEESVMRDAKTSGGFMPGTLRNADSSLVTWFLFASHRAEVSKKVEQLVKSRDQQNSYTHPNTMLTAKRGASKLSKMLQSLSLITLPLIRPGTRMSYWAN